MTYSKLAAVIVTGVIAVAATHSPASAASPITRSFLHNLMPNIDFLDRSSRFALTNSKNPRLHEFAFNEAKEQTLAANAVDAWTDAEKAASVTVIADGGDRVLTGRSVAIDRPAIVDDGRLPRGQEDLDSLEGLTGAEFDRDYRTKQLDALKQIQADYQDYIAKGDDPVLLGIANRELPKVNRRIMLIGKI